jgi:dephospho-CoA kinase
MVKGGADQLPPFIALTGAIGAGKSTALAALERLGAAVISSDAVVHELYLSDQVRDAVVARFGPEVAPGGVVDRGRLATVAFAAAESRAWLEGLIWPLVRQRVGEWRRQAGRAPKPPRALVVEVPLLFESGLDGLYDATIAVTADEAVRRERVGGRAHAAIDERAARQLSQADKAARATYVIANDGDVKELERKLSSVLVMLGV